MAAPMGSSGCNSYCGLELSAKSRANASKCGAAHHREARREVIGTTAFTLNGKIPPVGGLLINLIYPYSRLADLKCAQNKS